MADQYLGRGPSFPLRPDLRGRLAYVDNDEKVRQSIYLILSTALGERLMRPEFGCGIHDYVHQANTASLRGLLQQSVHAALVQWEPRIDVLQVRVETAPRDPCEIDIAIDYRIRDNNAQHNFVYPFFLNEGSP